MAGVQYVGGQLFPLTTSGEVPIPRQQANEIGSSVVIPRQDVVASTTIPPAPALVRAQAGVVVSPQAPITPKQVIGLARKRLREVKRELARMAKLEAEKAQLERLLAAADGRPIAVVRELTKKSAG